MYTKKVLVLEDSLERRNAIYDKLRKNWDNTEMFQVTYVESAEFAIAALSQGSWDILMLDHDLGEGMGTGMDVANWLVQNPEKAPFGLIILHSMNPVGRRNMFNLLRTKFLEDKIKEGF